MRFRYTGQQMLGQLGLYYYKARIYWPALGGFGGSVTAVSQGLIDLRAAANKDFAVTGTPSNSPGNISASSSGRAPAGSASCIKGCK